MKTETMKVKDYAYEPLLTQLINLKLYWNIITQFNSFSSTILVIFKSLSFLLGLYVLQLTP